MACVNLRKQANEGEVQNIDDVKKGWKVSCENGILKVWGPATADTDNPRKVMIFGNLFLEDTETATPVATPRPARSGGGVETDLGAAVGGLAIGATRERGERVPPAAEVEPAAGQEEEPGETPKPTGAAGMASEMAQEVQWAARQEAVAQFSKNHIEELGKIYEAMTKKDMGSMSDRDKQTIMERAFCYLELDAQNDTPSVFSNTAKIRNNIKAAVKSYCEAKEIVYLDANVEAVFLLEHPTKAQKLALLKAFQKDHPAYDHAEAGLPLGIRPQNRPFPDAPPCDFRHRSRAENAVFPRSAVSRQGH